MLSTCPGMEIEVMVNHGKVSAAAFSKLHACDINSAKLRYEILCELMDGLTQATVLQSRARAHTRAVGHYVLHVYIVQWNAGMGNTDTLHPNSCFCSFSIPTSRIKFLLLMCIVFYAHAHETTPTSICL